VPAGNGQATNRIFLLHGCIKTDKLTARFPFYGIDAIKSRLVYYKMLYMHRIQ